MQIITQLVGVNFRPAEAKAIVKELAIGDTLSLLRDPFNEYDSNAVKVMKAIGDEGAAEFIGFIARVDNPEIADHLDQGGEYKCEVIDTTSMMKPSLKVTLKPRQPEAETPATEE